MTRNFEFISEPIFRQEMELNLGGEWVCRKAGKTLAEGT